MSIKALFNRRGAVYFVMLLVLLGLIYKISTLHLLKINDEKTLREKGIYQSIKPVIVKGYRGNILDRNNKIMALTVPLKNIIIDPEQLIAFLAADYLTKEKQNFINKIAKRVKVNKGIGQNNYGKLTKILNLGSTELAQKINRINQTKKITIHPNNILSFAQISRLLKGYNNNRIQAIFKRRINQKIVQKIAQTLNLSSQALSLALMNSKSRKYLPIHKNLELNHSILHNVELLLNTKHKVHYKKQRYSRKYFGGAILLESHTKRYYPQSVTSAALLGFLNQEDKGMQGVEREYNATLAAKDGKKLMAYSGDKQPYASVKMLVEPQQGKDVKLTIDSNIQYFSYTALKNSVDKHSADYGSAIVLNAQGEILAMANYPSIDANNKSQYKPANYRNRVLLDAIEVGSTMKPFTALLALEQGSTTPDEVIDVSKPLGGQKVDKYKQLTTTQIIQKSHNLGIVTLGERFSKAQMWDMLTKLRFGQPTGAVKEIESQGLLKHYDEWHLSDKRVLTFGYGPMHTTLAQLARAYLIFLNEGKINNLTLVRPAKNNNNSRQVFSQKAIAQTVKILDKAVNYKGSGYAASIPGYKIAGKTGTTQLLKKNGSGYSKTKHNTFFVGFSPVHNPKYLIAVQINNPKGKQQGGSNVAAPVFKNIMENILKFK